MNRSNPWTADSQDLAKMKILVVDDEPLNVALLEEILAENDYTRFESISDSKLAIDAYKKIPAGSRPARFDDAATRWFRNSRIVSR